MGTRSSLIMRLGQFLTALAALVVVAFVYLYAHDYDSWYRKRHGVLVQSTLERVDHDPLSEKFWVSLQSSSGLTVRCGLLVPGHATQRYPAIILLGGKQTGRYAINYATDVRDAIVIAADYPYEPRGSYTLPRFLADAPAIRRALLDMVPSLMLIVDYLAQRPDVDTNKLILLGYSFGAPFVPAFISVDRRPTAVAMVYSGGNLFSLIRHNARRYESSLVSELVAAIGGLLVRPLEPLRYVDRIAPIPLIMINGEEDQMIPRSNTMELYNHAREPKTLIWLPSKHVDPRNVELTNLIVQTMRKELSRLGIVKQVSLERGESAGHQTPRATRRREELAH